MRAAATVAGVCQLTYFPLWAKGPAPALALAHSGLRWCGAFPADWAALKPTTEWSKLPLLVVPASDEAAAPLRISHELAILSWIGRTVPALGGVSDREWAASQQVMCECEDIYSKLTKFQPTTRQPDKCTPEQLASLWSSTDAAVHNRDQGLRVNLGHLDAFAASEGRAWGPGRLSATGTTVGESKLFATLHTLVLIEPSVLSAHPHLGAFYERFVDLAPTRAVLEDGGEMPGAFEQYFVRGDM